MYGYGMFWDPTYILVIIGVLITMAASAGVNSTYAKYRKVNSNPLHLLMLWVVYMCFHQMNRHP